MELSCQLSLRRSCLHARWIPRLQNEEADALTNGDFRHFDENLRIPVRLENFYFRVMNDFRAGGEAFQDELEEHKAAQQAAKEKNPQGLRERKVRSDQTLGKRDPW